MPQCHAGSSSLLRNGHFHISHNFAAYCVEPLLGTSTTLRLLMEPRATTPDTCITNMYVYYDYLYMNLIY